MARLTVSALLFLTLPALAAGQPSERFSQCLQSAAAKYRLNPNLLLAVKLVESGRHLEPQVRRNSNGSIDMGLMQINSVWWPTLKRFGIQPKHLLDMCVNLQVGAWILAERIAKYGLREGIGRYHSATPRHKKRYQQRVARAYARLAKP